VVHSSSTAPEPFLRVDWREARRHVGESVELEGNVAYAFRTDKAFYIAFQKPHQGAPMGIIDRRDESRFGDIPTVRPGQRVILRGTLRWYQGDPVVDIRGPESIVISDKDRGAEP
jgi:hypothetical protein